MEGKENKERIKREFVCGIKSGVVLSNSFILHIYYHFCNLYTNLYSLYEENVKTLWFVDFSNI